MKFGFVTCVQLGLSCIESIYGHGGKLDLLITLHDNKSRKKSGRIYLDDISRQHGVDLLKINHINDEEVIEAIRKYEIDWLFIIGWSQIAAIDVINAPSRGIIGAHPTLLPMGRGRAAIPWAILKGLDKTGVTFFKMDEGVDTGSILAQLEIPIASDETATVLYKKVDKAHETLIAQIWPALESDSIVEKPQDNSIATYWEGRTPKDGEINSAMSVTDVDRLVRATTHPYPGAFIVSDNKKVIIWKGKIRSLSTPATTNLMLSLRDGVYEIEQFSIEEL